MADIVTSIASSANFVPEAWSQRALDVLRAQIVLLDVVTKDVSYEPGWKGKVLHIPYPGRFTTVEKAEDTPITPITPTGGTGVNLTLNHHTVVPFSLENFVEAISQPQIMQRYIDSATISLAEAIETTLWTEVVPNMTGGSVGSAGTDLTASELRTAKRELDDNRAKQNNRYAVISPKDQVALLADSSLTNYFAFASSQSVLNGRIGSLYGLDVRMTQLAPITPGSPDSQAGLVLQEEAIMFASRPFPPIPAGAGVLSATSVDEESGLSVRLSIQWDVNNISTRANLDVLWGTVALRPTVGVLLTT